jgi:hypothetical protein
VSVNLSKNRALARRLGCMKESKTQGVGGMNHVNCGG